MRFRAALLFSVGVAAAAGCRCGPSLEPLEQGFLAPPQLDLGNVPVGEQRQRPIRVTSIGRGALRVAATVTPPFEVDTPDLQLPAGGTRDVRISIRPSILGLVEGVLTLGSGELMRTVRVHATGVDACPALDACRGTVFDDDAGLCRNTVLPDDLPCSTACLEAGRCSAGTCVGLFATCDDGDACTVDACALDAGCMHVPLECPVTDACRVARCDRQRGCVNDDLVADGTLCGSASCAMAKVCIGGECVERTTPNAAVDCRYTAACAAASYTCGSTVSGKLRCWGAGKALGRAGRVVSPDFVAGASQVKAPICDQTGPHWLTTAGTVGPTDPFVQAGAGLGPLGDVRSERYGWLALDANRRATMVRPPNPGFSTYAEDVVRLFPELCVQHADGGIMCAGGTRQIFAGLAPLDVTFSPYDFTWAALLPGGRVQTSAGLVLTDAGATAVGSLMDYRICWGAAGSLHCAVHWIPDSGSAMAWPEPFVGLTSGGSAICGVSDAGRLTCWGDNINGETSDRGTEPEGLIRLGDAGFSSIAVGFGEVLALRGEELFGTGSIGANPDGGRRQVSTTVNDSSLVSLGHWPGATHVGRQCLLLAGGLWCWRHGEAVRFMTGEIVRLCRTAQCAVDRTGRLMCVQTNGMLEVRANDVAPADECPIGCRLQRDGGVSCMFGPTVERRVLLPGPAAFVTEADRDGCAIVGTEVWCWTNAPAGPDGGIPAVRITGVRAPIRLLRAADGFRCAVSGQNGLQCWEGVGPVTDIAVSQPIADLEIGSGGWGANACVRYVSGDVDCFGNNQYGQLGFVPNTGQHAVQVVR